MISTVIFDMNGVIVDDEDLHEESMKYVFNEIGFDVTPEIYEKLCLGRTDIDGIKDLIKDYDLVVDSIDLLMQKKSTKYKSLVAEGKLIVISGVVDLINLLHQNYRLALTTGAIKDEVDVILKLAGIQDKFEVIITAEDVIDGKPNPEPYLLTAKKLNVDTSECLAIEDSQNGVLSAKAAGMKCIAVDFATDNNLVDKDLSDADFIIDNFSHITNDFITNLS